MTSAIIILNYNSAEITIRYLKDIITQDIYSYIVVVDNCSRESDAHVLSEYCNSHNIALIKTKENKGYSAGNNIGARYAIDKLHAEVIFISNPDIICPKNTIKRIMEVINSNDEIGVATGVVHVFDKQRRTSPYKYFAYKVPTYADMVLNNFYIATKYRMKSNKSMYYSPILLNQNGLLEVGCVSGCFFAIKSNVFNKIEGFDEECFLYYEEAILGYKLQREGYKVVAVAAPVYHDEDNTKRSGLNKIYRTHIINQRSARIYLKKYLRIRPFQMIIYRISTGVGFIEQLLITQLKMLK